MGTSHKFLAGSVGIAAMVAGQAAHAQVVQSQSVDTQAAASRSSAVGVGDIIVTANRREEHQQDVPISITAFSSERLQQQGITKAQDLAASVPSLVVGANGQASRDTQTFTLRGQGATFQASPGVVVYMAEVPLPAPITLSQQGGPGNYVDLESLQILAGPQGTLFGRNTTGGAVLLVPHKPTNELSGSVSAQYGNYNDNEFEGMLNVPVVDDKLLVRVSGAYHDRDGYTRDVTYNRNLDNVHWYTGRIGITFRPSSNFENYLMAYGTYSDNNGTALINKGFNIPLLNSYGLCGVPGQVPCSYYSGLTAQANALGPRAEAPGVLQGQTTRTWGVVNTSRVNLTDELLVRNIISYQAFKSNYYYDGDGTTVQQYDSSLPSNSLPRDDLKEFTEELQLQGTMLDNHLTFTVGGFYYNQSPAGEMGVNSIVFCPAAYTGFCPQTVSSVAVANKSKAIYAQGTLDFGALSPSLEGLRLTAGYRYTWDTINGTAYSYNVSRTVPGAFTCVYNGATVLTDPATGCTFSAKLHSKAPTWTAGLDYKLVPHVLLYAKVARGYKAGGFNSYAVRTTTETFNPEYVTDYEGGIKSDFHLGNIPTRFNANYYFLNYSNIQKATGDYNPLTNASGAAVNPAKAHVQGIEVEAAIRPIPQVEIGGNFSYTNFKYTQYLVPANGLPDCTGATPAPGTLSNIKCLPGQYVAPYIFSIHMAVNKELPGTMGALSFFVNYAHTSSQNTEAVVLPALQPGSILAGYGLLNASLDWKNISGTGIDAGVFVTNATDKLYRISNSDVNQSLGIWATMYGEPRMYGMRLRFHFGV
jgi:iron complex outermembrane receptor protein